MKMTVKIARGLFIGANLMVAGFLAPGPSSAATFTLSPSDDAFVYSQNPTWNYGDSSNLLVSEAFDGNGILTGERWTFLKFDLSGLAGISAADVTSVALRLYVNTTSNGAVEAYHSPDSWVNGPPNFGQATPDAATGITWNNKPSLAGEPLLGISPDLSPNNAFYSIDLLAGGNAWLAGDLSDQFLSVALILPSTVTTTTAYYFCSKEANPALNCGPSLQVRTVPAPDTDADGVADSFDSCTLVANPTQLDADNDGYGNICDGDLNGSGLTTATDYTLLRNVLNQPASASPTAAKADLNGSGLVTATDATLLRNRLNTVPGPSGYGCGQPAGSVACP